MFKNFSTHKLAVVLAFGVGMGTVAVTGNDAEAHLHPSESSRDQVLA